MGLMSMFPGGGGTNNQPLKAPTNFLVAANTQTSVRITWTDPENEYATPSGTLIGEWMFTRIIRKAGSAPVNANDGVVIVESAVKNQYQTTPYIDSGLVRGTVYYYGAFAYTKTRVQSPGAIYEYDLKGYDAVFRNNTWDTIAMACAEGVASEMWSVGDTKNATISGIDMEIQIVQFNPGRYTLTNGGGHPTMLLAPVYIHSMSPFNESNTITSYDRDGSSTLKSVISGYYNGISDLGLKNNIKQVSFNLEYADLTVGDGAYETSGYTFPISPYVYSSDSQRVKRFQNSEGNIVEWHSGNLFYGSDNGYDRVYVKYINTSGNYITSKVSGSTGWSHDRTIGEELGVYFGFCL